MTSGELVLPTIARCWETPSAVYYRRIIPVLGEVEGQP